MAITCIKCLRRIQAVMMYGLMLIFVSVVQAQQMLPVTVNNRWPGDKAGFQGYLTLPVDKPIHGWQARLVFDKPLREVFVWEGKILSNKDNRELIIGPVEYNVDLTPGKDLQVWFNAYGDQFANAKYSFETFAEPKTTVQPTVTTESGDTLMRYNYSEALGLSVLFYDAQRSGKLPLDNPVPWRGDSAVSDGDNGNDLSGGWYDGSGHVKFNFPMAYSTWVLAWGMMKFKDGYMAAGQLNKACHMIKWPLEYFLKCWIPDDSTLYVQVGEGHRDHSFWGRPENMNMTRPAFKVTPTCKGSDVSAQTVSALAAGHIVFTKLCSDAVFANKLLSAARSLFTFAKNNRGLYSDCILEAKDFYRSSDDKDDLSTAAAWLYKATAEEAYLNDSIQMYPSATPRLFSWNDVSSGAALLLYEATKGQVYKNDIEAFVNSYLPNGTVLLTPCGLAWLDQWGPNRYAANAAFIALMAAEEGIYQENYKTWALSQINYLLGDNRQNMSYEIGFGNIYPKNPHHRGSSCPTTSNQCSLADTATNPNELTGALVGGPNIYDDFTDSRNNYVQNDVACDFNAGFQSALAGLRHFAHSNELPPAPQSKC